MAKINANGDKLISCGEDFISCCDKYDDCINKLFDLLGNLQNTCWTGESARQYVNMVSREKSTYTAFGKDLRVYGKYLKNSGENINTMINKWRDK